MHIFHITDNNTWIKAKAEGIYRIDALLNIGFIHCCLPEQMDGVLSRWFKDAHSLVALEIDPERLTAKVIYENLEGGAELFPQVYGPINLEAIINIINIEERK